jgi:hypothetical protein
LNRATGSTWLDNAQEAEEQLNTSVAGETIELELPVMNPLWATLNLEDVQLDYSFEPEPEMHSRKGVDLMTTRLSLGSRARSHLLLQVRPDEPGMLRYLNPSPFIYASFYCVTVSLCFVDQQSAWNSLDTQ